MDIIPVTPAPQPELSQQNTSSPGKDDTGFDAILTEAVATTDTDSGRADNQPSNNNPESSIDLDHQATSEQETVFAEESPDDLKENNYNAVYLTTVALKASLEIPTGGEQTIPSQTAPSATEEITIQNNQNLKETPSQGKLPTASYIPVTPQGQKDIQLVNGPNNQQQNSLLLAEIQKLINQNSDKVTMTANFNNSSGRELPSYMSSPILAQYTPDGQATISISTSGASVAVQDIFTQGNTETQQPVLRQDTTEQFLNAKISAIETKNENDAGNKDSLQQNSNSDQQNTTQTAKGSGTGTSVSLIESMNTSQTFSSHFQSNSVTTVPSETITSPTFQSSNQTHLFYENEVVSQIVSRFSFHTKLQSGRMTLQLHPAELGELKIDIEMKGDSLKANIVAHTQQAQEIIEKNLPRLRAILQDQGLSIEDLIVTFQSDGVEDFSQQQSNFFRDQMTSFTGTPKAPPTASFEQSIEDVPLEEKQAQNSVDLTI